jgi:exodeoxyribonuclease VII small subunit
MLEVLPPVDEHEIPPEIAALSFEDALKQLEELVRQLEKGESRLDDAIRAYERGAALKRHCEAKLAEARLKVERISFGPGGEIGTEPMDRG